MRIIIKHFITWKCSNTTLAKDIPLFKSCVWFLALSHQICSHVCKNIKLLIADILVEQ